MKINIAGYDHEVCLISDVREWMQSAYSAGWCDGYKAKHVEPDWIDEGYYDWVIHHGNAMMEKHEEPK